MDAIPNVSPESMKSFLLANLDEFAEKLSSAVNDAAPGRLIADSEEPVREAGEKFVRTAFQAALQKRIDAAEAACPPSTRQDDRQEES